MVRGLLRRARAFKALLFMSILVLLFQNATLVKKNSELIELPAGASSAAMNRVVFNRPRLSLFGGNTDPNLGKDYVVIGDTKSRLNLFKFKTNQQTSFSEYGEPKARGLILGPPDQKSISSDPLAFSGFMQNDGEVGISIDTRTLHGSSQVINGGSVAQRYPVRVTNGRREILTDDPSALFPFSYGHGGMVFNSKIRIPRAGTVNRGVGFTTIYFKFLDSEGSGFWLGATVFNSNPHMLQQHLTLWDTAGSDMPIINDPLGYSDLFTNSPDSMLATSKVFDEEKLISFTISTEQFLLALRRIHSRFPSGQLSLDPRDYILERWSLDSEMTRTGGGTDAWIGLTATPGLIGINFSTEAPQNEVCSMPHLDYSIKIGQSNLKVRSACGCRENPDPLNFENVGAGCYMDSQIPIRGVDRLPLCNSLIDDCTRAGHGPRAGLWLCINKIARGEFKLGEHSENEAKACIHSLKKLREQK